MIEIKQAIYILPLLASLFTVAGQMFYKFAATVKDERSSVFPWLSTLFAGNILFLASVVSNFIAMKFIHLFVVFAFTALNYVFVTLLSGLILKERIKINNIIASTMIALGVFLITLEM